ncbi:unnamed protein product [Prorocentrum cordatum]|uniref:Uncharacterized protein n=1 Tax=Prorocentrum cordatum TaxID=2364126 RepID=A0ABN9UGY5_9DINO|nr:unnamed protein product [Polarella glacialis]
MGLFSTTTTTTSIVVVVEDRPVKGGMSLARNVALLRRRELRASSTQHDEAGASREHGAGTTPAAPPFDLTVGVVQSRAHGGGVRRPLPGARGRARGCGGAAFPRGGRGPLRGAAPTLALRPCPRGAGAGAAHVR